MAFWQAAGTTSRQAAANAAAFVNDLVVPPVVAGTQHTRLHQDYAQYPRVHACQGSDGYARQVIACCTGMVKCAQ
jgi:hypothetical protein